MHPLRHLMKIVESRAVLDESGTPTQPAQIAWKKEKDYETRKTVWTGMFRVPTGSVFQINCAGNDKGWAIRLLPQKGSGPRRKPLTPPQSTTTSTDDPDQAKRRDMAILYATFFAGLKSLLESVKPGVLTVLPADASQGNIMQHLFGHLMPEIDRLGYVRDSSDGLRLRRKDSMVTWGDVR